MLPARLSKPMLRPQLSTDKMTPLISPNEGPLATTSHLPPAQAGTGLLIFRHPGHFSGLLRRPTRSPCVDWNGSTCLGHQQERPALVYALFALFPTTADKAAMRWPTMFSEYNACLSRRHPGVTREPDIVAVLCDIPNWLRTLHLLFSVTT
jgi:hypothetical protein